MRTCGRKHVLKAHVERGIRMRCECHPRLSYNIFRSSILIAHGIFDLRRSGQSSVNSKN